MNELPAQHAGITVVGGPTSRQLTTRVEEVDAECRMRLHEAVGGIGDRVHVRWISSRGAAEVPCVIEPGEWVGIWWLRPVGSPTIEQRRRFFRVDVAMPISMTVATDDKALQAWAVDLSEGGLRAVTVDVALVDGQQVGVAFDLENGAHIEGNADVLRTWPDGNGFATVVLSFAQLPDLMQDRIRQFVFKSQMRAGART